MKILHVCNHFYPCIGGIEKYVEDLCLNLIAHGYTSDVCCLNTCSNSTKKLPALEMHGKIRIFRLPCTNLRFYKMAPKVMKFIKHYDVIHIHGIGFFSDFISLSKYLHRKPLVLSTHGGIFHTRKIHALKTLYFRMWCRFVLRFVNKVIAHSKNDFELFSMISKPVLIPYAIDFKRLNSKRDSVDNSFVFVGRLSKNKRVDRLLDLAFHMKNRIGGFKLYIVGDGGERHILEEKTKQLDLVKNVVFTGEKRGRELLKYYSRSRFLVSASEYEGFGISVLEAMAAGCVVVVNDIKAFRNFVDDGVNGFISDFSDPEKTAKLISDLYHRELSAVQKNAMFSAKKYDWIVVIEKMESVYNNLI